MPSSTDTSIASSHAASTFGLGCWRVDPNRNVISREGSEKRLENRLMQTLVFLCERQGQVIQRGDFFNVVWRGRVVNDEALSRAISLLRTALEDDAARPEYIKTVPGIGYMLIAPVAASASASIAPGLPPAEPGEDSSIAVLPFVNLSNDPGNEYLSDGISEEIINSLVQIPDFRVVGRTSSFAFKGVNDDLRKVGHALGVSHVLEGSLRLSGDLIRVTAQLIKADDGFHLWSKNFQCELQDIFAIQDAIAAGVAEEMKRSLLGVAGRVRETSVDAYSLYLQGVYLLRSGEVDKLPRALAVFREVTQLDPDYAPAWVSLADTYWYLTSYGMVPRAEAMVLADAACERALSLDESLAEAHTCKANLCIAFSCDWARAGVAIERALQLAPGHSGAALNAGNLARTLGDFPKAVAYFKQAVASDPLNMTGHIWLANTYLALGSYAEASAIIHKALDLNPRRVVLNTILVNILLCQQQYGAAYERALLEPEGFWHDFSMVMCLYHLQRTAEADARFAALVEANEDEAPFQIAEIHCVRGDYDRAFVYLDLACKLHDNGLVQILASTWLRPLHGDSRWPAVLRRLNIPWKDGCGS
ncbi:tetratricopeptide repeat protein [Haliea sp. E17]|uniref:tetratricopeptide repeat protein n=1 Tax=Haliea sp. E17 TaxID=3401576 RepID=UPI003AB04DA2